MQIPIKYKTSKKVVVLVRRISWEDRCREQLNKIIGQLKNIKSDLETAKNNLEGILYE